MVSRHRSFEALLSLFLAWVGVFLELAAAPLASAELVGRPLYHFADLVPRLAVISWLGGGGAAIAAAGLDRTIGTLRSGWPPARIALQLMTALVGTFVGLAWAFQQFHCYAAGV